MYFLGSVPLSVDFSTSVAAGAPDVPDTPELDDPEVPDPINGGRTGAATGTTGAVTVTGIAYFSELMNRSISAILQADRTK